MVQFIINPFTSRLDAIGTGGGGGGEVLTINTISPDGSGNFTIESLDSSVTITPEANAINLSVPAGAGGIVTIDGNTGSVTGSTVSLVNPASSGTPSFVGSGTIMNMYLDSQDTLFNLGLGTQSVGYASPTGAQNVGVGTLSGQSIVGGTQNTSIAYQSLLNCTSGNQNIAVGPFTLYNLTSGDGNIAICIGNSLLGLTSESYNVWIQSSGEVGDNNILRIGGATGTGAFELNKAFIQGIVGNDPVADLTTPTLAYIDTTDGQLGNASYLVTAPAFSSIATTAFGTSLTSGMPVQNTLGYNIMLNISVSVTAATGATLTLGVDSTATPTTDTVIQSFSAAAATIYTFTAIVPNNYYVVVNSTGTITIGSINVQVCAM
jgi:hypothetical protein